MKLYQAISCQLSRLINSEAQSGGNSEANAADAREKLHAFNDEFPHGSGFDSGCKLNLDDSKPDRLIFSADFHHMDENGYYDGWSIHQVIVTPSLQHGFNIRVTGRDRNQIKDYIADCFVHSLMVEV